jgi:comEA protein
MVRNIFASLVIALAVVTAAATSVEARQRDTQSQVASAPINLNSATQADLEKLPGIGAATAKAIIEYRQKNGGFKKVEELMNVKGIGEKSFLKLKTLVTVAPAKITDR